MLHYPFWLAIPPVISEKKLPGDKNTPWIFSTAEKMAAFLAERKSERWETKLVDRYSARAVFMKLLDDGYSTVWQDVGDTSGRSTIALAEILAALSPAHSKNCQGLSSQ
jgi:hypothetical protein